MIDKLKDYFGDLTVNDHYNIPHATTFRALVQQSSNITIIGDYDVDGIMSTRILSKLCMNLGIRPYFRIPHRFSEGYGINVSIVEAIPDNSTIITVDNGITCIEALARAKQKGCKVIIVDHHNHVSKLPEADLIIDPYVDSTGFDYKEYCGAGLAYKLYEAILGTDAEALQLAAVATIADSVPLTGDNRKLVTEGLEQINSTQCIPVISTLLKEMDIESKVFSDTIAYYIAPALNAPGRLLDDGSEKISYYYISGELNKVSTLIALNDQRKQQVEDALKLIPSGNNIVWLYGEKLNEGICGIVANRLSEIYRKPAFVIAKTETRLKGSCRCPNGFNVFSMLQGCSHLLKTYGGHDEAAAYSLDENCLTEFIETLEKVASKTRAAQYKPTYDLVLEPSEAMKAVYELEKYEPYGQGCRKPLFMLEGEVRSYRIIKEKHLKLNINSITCIAWNKAHEYQCKNYPSRVRVIGYLEKNVYRNSVSPQIKVKQINYL